MLLSYVVAMVIENAYSGVSANLENLKTSQASHVIKSEPQHCLTYTVTCGCGCCGSDLWVWLLWIWLVDVVIGNLACGCGYQGSDLWVWLSWR